MIVDMRLVVDHGVEDEATRLLHRALDDIAAELRRVGGRLPAGLWRAAQEQARTEFGRFAIPAGLQMQHMGGVARRQSGDDHQAAIHQPCQIPGDGRTDDKIGQCDRAVRQTIPDLLMPRAQARRAGVERTLAERKGAALGQHLVAGNLIAQRVEHAGILHRQQAQRHHAARPERKAEMLVEPHLAVAAET